MKFNIVEIIIKKRDGGILSSEEINFAFTSYINKKIPDYQMSSLLMAIFQQGMNPEEIAELAKVYIESGDQIKFSTNISTVDKHSTGGVGDKISLILAPIVAACGSTIPMISGRGLGHTGGTLDKLESIPGFRTDFNEQEFKQIIKETGFSIISQSKELVPVDKMIYALRDVTGTVESLPLITASIMSKKIAEGAKNLVIDLKVGAGAFIKNMEKANELAELLQKTGKSFNQRVSVVYTNMNSPLGYYCGNGLEVQESIEFLRGNYSNDIYQITKKLAVEMLLLTGKAGSIKEAEIMIDSVIENGSALQVFRDFIKRQGGDPNVCDDVKLLPQASHHITIPAPKSGWIKQINSQAIGYALLEVGAGRRTLNSDLDYSSGAYLPYKIGDKITKGEQLGILYCNDPVSGKSTASKIQEAFNITGEKVDPEKLILKISSAVK